MARCTFCGNNIEKGTGKIFVKKDATIYYFCSNRCEKNLLKLHRVPRTLKWTQTYEDFKKQEKIEKINPEKSKKEANGSKKRKIKSDLIKEEKDEAEEQ